MLKDKKMLTHGDETLNTVYIQFMRDTHVRLAARIFPGCVI